jgi:hypothetical protein
VSKRGIRKTSELAERLGQLLAHAPVRNDPEALGIVDDLLGAVYALAFARRAKFVDRPKQPVEGAVITKRAKQLAKGKIRRDGKWMAGFHFNNTLYRIAACYHRALVKVTGDRDRRIDNLVPKAKGKFEHWKNDNLGVVHDQVNNLKHEPRGTHDRRLAKLKQAGAAIAELLDLMEAWAALLGTAPVVDP